MLNTSPKPFIFVLMPFSEEFFDIYELGIKDACHDAGAYCERVDEQIFDGKIVERIYNQISKADVVVADMTGRSANVFYEVGYAHALGKRVILLTRESTDIPFDLKDYPHIRYGQITELKSDLTKRLVYLINNPKEKRSKSNSVEVYLNGVNLQENCLKITGEKKQSSSAYFYTEDFIFKLHNSIETKIETSKFYFGMILPDGWFVHIIPGDPNWRITQIPTTKERQFLWKNPMTLLPGVWESCKIGLGTKDYAEDEVKVNCRVFSDDGYRDHPFSFRYTIISSD